jgi:hypothetical protein
MQIGYWNMKKMCSSLPAFSVLFIRYQRSELVHLLRTVPSFRGKNSLSCDSKIYEVGCSIHQLRKQLWRTKVGMNQCSVTNTCYPLAVHRVWPPCGESK